MACRTTSYLLGYTFSSPTRIEVNLMGQEYQFWAPWTWFIYNRTKISRSAQIGRHNEWVGVK
jgi:hypothetical protein